MTRRAPTNLTLWAKGEKGRGLNHLNSILLWTVLLVHFTEGFGFWRTCKLDQTNLECRKPPSITEAWMMTSMALPLPLG